MAFRLSFVVLEISLVGEDKGGGLTGLLGSRFSPCMFEAKSALTVVRLPSSG